MDNNMLKLVVLGCLVALSMAASGITVTPFTGCTRCAVEGVLFPSNTAYLMQTSDSVVWRSADEGQTWTKVLGNVDYMEASPADPLSILFICDADLYTSTDGGQTTTKTTPPGGFISGITMHPLNPTWIMTYICTSVACTTYYSKDFGKSWKNGPNNLARNYILWSDDPDTPDNIFAVRTQNAAFSYTSNYGQTWTQLFTKSLGYVLSDNFLYVGVAKTGSTATLYASSTRRDATHTQLNNYLLAEFPSGNDLPEMGYTFLDDSTRAEFIAVKTPSSRDTYGTLYTSDFDGDQFALSLNYIAQDDLLYDFDKFNGLTGIFVANAYQSANAQPTARQTYMTFDNGGDWQKLAAPKTNALGVPTNCSLTTGCSLHIHGLISWYNNVFPPFYSSPNAIGLMVAVGNMGTSLAADTKTSKTYFTRDAGLTWAEIYNGPTIYEFGNHGSVLVFAPISSPTNNFFYSLDEGKTSQTMQFSTTAMYVDNIFIEPQGTGLKFVLIGHTGSGPNIKNYIFGLDFTGLNLPSCGDNDYENFIPHNGDSANIECFMGNKTTYQRRKQDSQCYNSRDTDHVLTSEPCLCDWEDYECDVGFGPSARNKTDYFVCTPLNSGVPNCATGYRLIPDDGCEINGGLDLRSANCPGYSGTPTTITTSTTSTTGEPSATTGGNNGGKKSHGGAVAAVVIIFIVLFGGAATVGVLYYKNENFREWVLAKFSSNASSSAGYGRVNTDVDDEEAGEN